MKVLMVMMVRLLVVLYQSQHRFLKDYVCRVLGHILGELVEQCTKFGSCNRS